MYAFKCGKDNKNKIKRVPKKYSKNFKFDDYKKCLDGSKYQKDFDNYNIESLNHDMFLQGAQKSTLSQFDDKRCSESNIESKQGK